MKTYLFSVMIPAFALMAFHANASPVRYDIHAPVTINWTVYQQKLDDFNVYPGNGKTNITGPKADRTTNVLQISKYSFTTATINNAKFLALLENSLNTNLPSGTQLAFDGDTLYLVDHSGTNKILSLSSVLTSSSGSTNEVLSGSELKTTTSTKSGTSTADAATGLGNQFFSIKYDDSALDTKDLTTTQFKFEGVSAFTESTSSTTSIKDITTGSTSINYTLRGSGDGLIRGTNSVLSGTITGTITETHTDAP